MRTLTILALLACLGATGAMADPPSGKGKDKDKPGVEQPIYAPSQPGKGNPPGQITSGCNHQANDIGLKGQQRKEFVERCQRRGGDKWNFEESGHHCRARAEELGLRGDDKDRYIRRCREYRDDVWAQPLKVDPRKR